VARIEVAPEVFADFRRILAHLHRHDVAAPEAGIGDIIAAIDILAHSPEITRPIEGGLRDLVIGTRSRGDVALYRYVATVDTVFILAIRGQRESGHARGD
jgi:toxin ParE1/3/4